jgi:dolichol-phosphate mannosyltransferase
MRPPQSKVSVALATYNEREHIVHLVAELYQKIAMPLEVIVVDDDSTDGTAELVAELKFPGLKLIRRKVRGLASAFHRGILESTGDIVCWMDADMCMPVDVLKQMIDKLDAYDIAVGSRYAEGGSDNRSPLRVLSSRLINRFARLVLGGHVKDYDSGFVALKRSVFDWVTIIPFGYGEYFIEMISDALRHGLKVVEVGYAFRDRTEGISKSLPSLWAFARTGLHYVRRIMGIRWKYFRGRR